MDLLLDTGNPLGDPTSTDVYTNPNEAVQRSTAAIQLSLPSSLFSNETFYDSPQAGVDVSVGTDGQISVRGRPVASDSLTGNAQTRAAAAQSRRFSAGLASVPVIVWLGLAALLIVRK